MLCASIVSAQQSSTIYPSSDGKAYSAYIRGDKPVTGDPEECLSGWTCEALGSSTAQYDAIDSDTIEMTRLDGSGWATIHADTPSEQDFTRRACKVSQSGDTSGWASWGAFALEGTFASGYLSRAQYPFSQSNTYVIFDSNGGGAATTTARYTCYGVKYVGSTNTLTFWGSNTDMTHDWVLLATSTANNFDATKAGFYVHSNSSATAATVRLDVDKNSYTFTDTGEPPPSGSPPSTPNFTNKPGGPAWVSGVGSLVSVADYTEWRNWSTYDADVAIVWMPRASQVPTCGANWNDIATDITDGNCNYYVRDALNALPSTTPIVISLLGAPADADPNTAGAQTNYRCGYPALWTNYVAGSYDSYWTSFANNLKTLLTQYNRSASTVVLRMWWEANGDWYDWSICTGITNYKAAYNRIAGIIEGILPGVWFDASFAREYTGYTVSGSTRIYSGAGDNLATMVPSAADVIGFSLHDGCPFTTNDQTWAESSYNPGAGSRRVGLVELYATAQALGKKIGFPEWATQFANTGGCWNYATAPDVFLGKVYDWMASINPAWIAYEGYFAPGYASLHNVAKTGPNCTYFANTGCTNVDRRTLPASILFKSRWDQ